MSTATVVPTLPFNLLAGAVWGPFAGGCLSALAASTGAVLAFAIARSGFRSAIRRKLNNGLVSQVLREIDGEGWRFIVSFR